MKINVGGSGRIHSGGKISQEVQDFNRANHNLNKIIRLNVAPGVIYPFYSKRVKPGDTFDIENIEMQVYTDPTLRAMYGHYKAYIEFYYAPTRLTQAWLHNNKEYIGEDMSQVKLPIYDVTANNIKLDITEPIDEQQISPSSLVAFLGERSWGRNINTESETVRCIKNAEKHILYYDIYKNYYANRQEKVGWIVDYAAAEDEPLTVLITFFGIGGTQSKTAKGGFADPWNYDPAFDGWAAGREFSMIELYGNDLKKTTGENGLWYMRGSGDNGATYENYTFNGSAGWIVTNETIQPDGRVTKIRINASSSTIGNTFVNWIKAHPMIVSMPFKSAEADGNNPNIESFPLTNIDDMREDILAAIKSKTAFTITADTYEPYGNAFKPMKKTVYLKTDLEKTNPLEIDCLTSYYDMQSLALCTYNSDKLNNWLDSEYIENYFGTGGRGIVDVTNGLNLDALKLAMKIYNQSNKTALGNRSYDDWMLVIHGQNNQRPCEIPVYEGGMTQGIYFQEMRSTAATEGQPVGSIVSNAVMGNNKKGGKIVIRCEEIGWIMAMVRIVPQIIYSQGNNPDNDALTIDDIHQPDLDGIGFQDLLTERFAAAAVQRADDGTVTHTKIGKQPAWIDYMTDIDEAYGDFARENNKMSMTLNRKYNYDEEGNVIDATTYIDPAKYNYIWAGVERKAQHFDMHIGMKITPRRKLSTRQMPNFN